MDIELYKTPSGNIPIEDYVEKLAKKHKAQEIAAIRLFIKRLHTYGLNVNRVYRNTIKHVRDGIYELRPNTTRVFFFCFTDKKIVLLHAFEKKRQTLPPDEIEKALKERENYLRRDKNG